MPEQYADTRSAAINRQQSFPLPNGERIELAQIGLQDYQQIEAEALADHKRSFLKTYSDNLDLVPEASRAEVMSKAFDTASQMTLESLGEREIDVPVTKNGRMQFDDSGALKVAKKSVPYAAWWMSETISGRLMAVWFSIRNVESQKNWTYKKSCEILTQAMQEAGEQVLEEAAQIVGQLSESKLSEAAGNSQAPAATPG